MHVWMSFDRVKTYYKLFSVFFESLGFYYDFVSIIRQFSCLFRARHNYGSIFSCASGRLGQLLVNKASVMLLGNMEVKSIICA